MAEELSRFCHPLPVSVPNCIEELLFAFNDSFTDIVMHFVDKHHKHYVFFGTTDANGELVVETNVFPTGLFNPYAGSFTVYATYFGLPDRQRIFFRDDTGYYPSMLMSIDDTIYTNFNAPNQFGMLNGSRFVCCCTNNRPCKNLVLKPCTGDGTDCFLCCGEYEDFTEIAQAVMIAIDNKEYHTDGVSVLTPGFPIIATNSNYFEFSNTEYYIAAGINPGEFILYKRELTDNYPLNTGVPAFDCYLPFNETDNNITNANIPIVEGEIVSQCLTFKPIDPATCQSISICWEVSIQESRIGFGIYQIDNVRVCMGDPDVETGTIERCKNCDIPLSTSCAGMVANGFVLYDLLGDVINPPYVFNGATDVEIEFDFSLPTCCRDTCWYLRMGESYHEGVQQTLSATQFTFPFANPASCPVKRIPITIAAVPVPHPLLNGSWVSTFYVDTLHCGSITFSLLFTKL